MNSLIFLTILIPDGVGVSFKRKLEKSLCCKINDFSGFK